MELLQNKIALVSSSTRGIGLACAKRMAFAGAKVYLGVRRLDAGRKIAEEIRSQGGRADVVYFDAKQEETYTSMVEDVIDREGRIDILVNNYGATDVGVDHDLLNGDSARFFEIVTENLKSVYLPSKAAVACMKKTGGSIVNISSVGGVYPDLSRTAYGVAKAGINFLTKDIAVQYAKDRIRCNAVLPGFTATDAATGNMSEAFLSSFLKNVPLDRPGKPEDMADAALFFASSLSDYVTGTLLEVAGGFGLPTPMCAMYQQMQSKG